MSVIEQTTERLSKVPRGVWIAAVGTGCGIGVIFLIRNRDKPEPEKDPESSVTNSGQINDGASPVFPPYSAAGPASGIESGTGSSPYTNDPQAWIENWLEGFNRGVEIGERPSMPRIEGPGANATPIVTAPPYEPPPIAPAPPPYVAPAPVAPVAPPPPAYRVEYDNRQRDNGKRGAARRVWCVRVKIHRYPDGRAVVVSEDKIKDGACP